MQRVIPAIGVHVIRIPDGAPQARLIDAYRRDPFVEFVEPDLPCHPALIPNDEYYSFQWHLPAIHAPEAWDETIGDGGVHIAVLDTGLNTDHPELAGQFVPGWNIFDDNDNTADVTGHGTRVAGTLVAAGNNGTLVASVAWGCKVMPIRVSNQMGLSTSSLIADGLVWAADHGARVANISFELTDSSTITAAAQYFQSKGGVVVLAAGNSGLFEPAADDPFVIRVSAFDQGLSVPSWSNIGNNVDLAAPGVGIITLDANGSFASASGTSHSAPIVAGVAALVLSANADLAPMEIQQLMFDTAIDGGDPGWDSSYGWGRIDAYEAVTAALGGGEEDTTPPTVTITAPISGTVVSGDLFVSALASDDRAVVRVDLLIDGAVHSTDQVAPHEWSIDTRAMPDGGRVLTAEAWDAAGNSAVSAPVALTVSNATPCDCPPDCSEPAATESKASTCGDGLDNDCDGAADCDDEDCVGAAGCPECLNDSDCTDGDPCTTDACDLSQTCVFSPVVCSAGFECVAGGCEPVICNQDGTCGDGEDCHNCPTDCFSTPGSVCGDGVCNPAIGEDCLSCPGDCAGEQGGPPSGRYCCGAGGGSGAVGCADARCSADGFACSDAANPATCCGDWVCDRGEDAENCSIDCGESTWICGNGVCDPDETRCGCPADCGAPATTEQDDALCGDGSDNDCDGLIDCHDPDCAGTTPCPVCNSNGICEPGEDCRTCPKDCSGASGRPGSPGFCCGNGAVEGDEATSDFCDGNP